MIVKHNSFVHRNALKADYNTLYRIGILERELMFWAFNFSQYPEAVTNPLEEVRGIISRTCLLGNKSLTDLDLSSFIKASREAYRVESSIMHDKKIDDGQTLLKHFLVFRIKFYKKDKRLSFLEWEIIFGGIGHVTEMRMTGPGVLLFV